MKHRQSMYIIMHKNMKYKNYPNRKTVLPNYFRPNSRSMSFSFNST